MDQERNASNNDEVLQKAVKYLTEKKEIIGIFPEGKITPDGEIHVAKNGMARIAIMVRKKILPVRIHIKKILGRKKFAGTIKGYDFIIGKPLHVNKDMDILLEINKKP